MSVFSGPSVISNGLVFSLDAATPKNQTVFSANFYQNSGFANGTGMPQESGSNPTNDIVQLENPGESAYVLRQSAGTPYTEYQINLTTELQSSTTYCMSGWYAESADYSCADGSRMFHARANSSSGNHIATGVGIGTTLKTVVINGITWRYCYETISTPSDYNNDFNWYVGYGGNTYTGYRYYTNLKMEKGTFPSLIDLSNNNNHANCFNGITFNSSNGGSLSFDGTNDFVTVADASILTDTDSLSIDIWFRSSDIQTRVNDLIGKGSSDADEEYCIVVSNTWIYFDVGNGAGPYAQPSTTLNNNTWYNVVGVHSRSAGSSTLIVYLNGVALSSSVITPTNSPNDNSLPMSIGRRFYNSDPFSRTFNGLISGVKIYNRTLTAAEVYQNFQALRGRYGV